METEELDQKVTSLLDKTGIPAVEEDKKEEPKETESQEKDKEAQDPESEASTDENKADDGADEDKDKEPEDSDEEKAGVSPGVQKKINKEVRKRKEAQERVAELEQKLAELEANKGAEPKEPEESVGLSHEEQVEIIVDRQVKAMLTEDKDKPIEKRRFLSDDEANDLMIDNPSAYNRYMKRSEDLRKEIEGATMEALKPTKKEPEIKQPSQEEAYKSFVKDYPKLDYVQVLNEAIEKHGVEDDEAVEAFLKEKDPEIAEFLMYVKDNQDLKDINLAAKKFYAKKESDKINETLEENKRLQAEIDRLKGLDNGVGSTASSKPDKGKTKEQVDIDSKVSNLLSKAGIK